MTEFSLDDVIEIPKGLADILNMKKEDFYKLAEDGNLPQAKCGDKFASIVILPTEDLHESGFAIMHFILLDNNDKPIAKGTHSSDVLEVLFNADAWAIDCLPCGLLRFFHYSRYSKVIFNLSGFQIEPTYSRIKEND